MLTITLATALLLYGIFVFAVAILFFVNMYHLAANASLTFPSFVATTAVLSLSVLVLFGTWSTLRHTDWTAPIVSLDSSMFDTDTIPTL